MEWMIPLILALTGQLVLGLVVAAVLLFLEQN
jgi:hypothetical protein